MQDRRSIANVQVHTFRVRLRFREQKTRDGLLLFANWSLTLDSL